jgi:hypothetical protein
MAAVPPTGQISVSDIISAANDQYATPDFSTNVSLSALRARLKLGQSNVPSSNLNVGFSSTRNSQFITYKITAYPESVSTYATNNNGIIEVEIDEEMLVGYGLSVTVSLSTGETETKNIIGTESNIFSLTGLSGDSVTARTVTVRDNLSAHQVSDSIIVPYGGTTNNVVFRNRA